MDVAYKRSKCLVKNCMKKWFKLIKASEILEMKHVQTSRCPEKSVNVVGVLFLTQIRTVSLKDEISNENRMFQ